MKPTIRKAVTLCDCYEGDFRGKVQTFYKRENQQLKCSNCGNIPPELSARPIPDSHRIEIQIIHHLDDEQTRQYEQVMHPEQ